ncbi:hypothetical protein PoB_004732400 [Plakobranchus ocellatus]|uniref:Secreted protein n=1 Tax=Plakobranchus ocellatus TaxID=259542 RepID=A0AAV4BR48_9GAST|nr:hypothetical protein PoB_004732400 [Plakobranchus ocellatus]
MKVHYRGSARLTVAVCVCLISVLLVEEIAAIQGGTQVDMCDYPGIAAVLASDTNIILCSGVTQTGDILLLPELCQNAVVQQLTVSDVTIKYGDGDNTIKLSQGSSAAGSLTDGVWRLQLPAPLSSPCELPATLYDSATMGLDPGSCQLVGFGADTLATQTYDKTTVRATPVTKSTSAPCCDIIRPTISDWNLSDWLVDDSVPLNCLTSPGAACSVADVGAPIFCETTSGDKVVIALTASAPCVPGATFVAHDLTAQDPSLKFGLQ